MNKEVGISICNDALKSLDIYFLGDVVKPEMVANIAEQFASNLLSDYISELLGPV